MYGNVGGRGSEINAYAFVDASSGTPSITKAKNITSITDTSVGIHTLNMNALPSVNYSWSGSAVNSASSALEFVIYENASTRSTTSLPILVSRNGTFKDTKFSVIITGA